MQTFTGTWPAGSPGTVVLNVNFPETVWMGGYCLKIARLACCSVRLDHAFVLGSGAVVNQGQVGLGESVHYNTRQLGSPLDNNSGVNIDTDVQGFQLLYSVGSASQTDIDACAGEPYEIKACLIVSDTNRFFGGSYSCICDQTCGSQYSYVDIW